jgi:hypothetical protein
VATELALFDVFTNLEDMTFYCRASRPTKLLEAGLISSSRNK